jgi:ferredoxin
MTVKVSAQPDNVTFEVMEDESVLHAGLRANLGFAHACGGRA